MSLRSFHNQSKFGWIFFSEIFFHFFFIFAFHLVLVIFIGFIVFFPSSASEKNYECETERMKKNTNLSLFFKRQPIHTVVPLQKRNIKVRFIAYHGWNSKWFHKSYGTHFRKLVHVRKNIEWRMFFFSS